MNVNTPSILSGHLHEADFVHTVPVPAAAEAVSHLVLAGGDADDDDSGSWLPASPAPLWLAGTAWCACALAFGLSVRGSELHALLAMLGLLP